MASKEDILLSDRRRETIKALGRDVIREVQNGHFHAATKVNHKLLSVIEEEQLVPHLADHYEIMARVYLAAKDRGSAKKFARMALGELKSFGGADMEDKVKEVESLMAKM
jgi:hypothetical protein